MHSAVEYIEDSTSSCKIKGIGVYFKPQKYILGLKIKYICNNETIITDGPGGY